ncbi:hypothetical protein CA13_62480 [Planctomycetes bacterium CA13]|uniref:Uncharacterized protein n=1 Tax=Novipirellula herctigrandis TaxID=2527986 RepID=A0A5C5ZC97_9BACT|nr:hypothetical protein CA13_62480 [Planctomycetes bacterium CA13]
MKRLLLVIAVALTTTCLISETTQAQWSNSSTTSSSSSYSKSWGSSQGIGPNGYYNNNFSTEESKGSVTQNNSYTNPWGGGNTGSTQNWGSKKTSFNNSGATPWGGAYNNSGGSFNSFNNGQTWNNNFRW